MHPRSKHWHLIDYILVRQKDKADVRVTKSMCGADCWTNHRLIISKMKFVLQPPKRPQGPKAPKKMDAAKLSTPAMKETLQTRLNGVLENHVSDPGNIGSSCIGHVINNALTQLIHYGT